MADTPRIMIVEDEIVVAMEIRAKLSARGYEIVGIFSDGDRAVQEAQQVRPDLVLMDIMLAGNTDGIEAARLLYELGIPVVFLTAYSDETTLQRAKLSEPYGYLLKPFSAAELHTTIEVALHKHRKERKARQAVNCFSETVELVGGAVIVTDERGIIRHMNSLAEALTGWKEVHAQGKSLRELCSFASTDKEHFSLDALYGRLRVPGWKVKALPVTMVARSGEHIPVELTVSCLDDHMNGTTVIWGLRETTPQESDDQDWFSQAVNLHIAAQLALSKGKVKEAETFCRRALALFEDHLGRSDPRTIALVETIRQLSTADPEDIASHLLTLRSGGISP